MGFYGVNFRSDDLEEVEGYLVANLAKLRALKSALKNEVHERSTPGTSQSPSEPKPDTQAEPKAEAKRGPGRPKKIVEEAVKPAPVPKESIEKAVTSVKSETPLKPVTREEAFSALSAYNSKFAIERTRALLKKYGAIRLSDIKEDKLPEFFKTCLDEMSA